MNIGIKLKSGPPTSADAPCQDADDDVLRQDLCTHYTSVRAASAHIADPLTPEDQTIQSMPDVSPTKWHLAHTTWFFETFLLKPFLPGYRDFDPSYAHLFNSYYHTVGSMHARPRRGLLSRPGVEDIRAYRAHVDAAMLRLMAEVSAARWSQIAGRLVIGLNHEQQHQELMLTDIKHVLSCNPLLPAAYGPPASTAGQAAGGVTWHEFGGEIRAIGHDGAGFAFDNELPRHDVLMPSFALASRPVTNGEYRAFIEDGGYETVTLWLSDGWTRRSEEGWRHPLYWREQDGAWFEFTLHGLVPLDPDRTVCHLSFYEAQAFAAWAGKRLPTEAELEFVLESAPPLGNLFTAPAGTSATDPMTAPHTGIADDKGTFSQLYGDVWEWTMSPYTPYPGFTPLDGSLGEYNGKFMCNQLVLKGGSCATPADHIRASYRNFFPPDARWQFSGLRLASDVSG